MPTNGQVLREIRLAKGLRLKDIATDQLSTAFISKVERDESDISLSRFEVLLDRLHVSYNEFSYRKNNYALNHQAIFLKQLSQYMGNDNICGLQSLYKQEQNLFAIENNRNTTSFHNMTLVQCCLAEIQKAPLPQESIQQLQHFLLNTDSWGIYELRLFSNAMFIFPNDILSPLLHTVIERSKVYLDLLGYTELLSTLFGNALELLITRNQLETANFISVTALKTLDFEHITLSNIKVIFFSKILRVNSAKDVTACADIRKVIDGCYHLGAPKWADNFNHWFEKWLVTHP